MVSLQTIEEILKTNLINFLNIAYTIILVDKTYFTSYSNTKCENFNSEENQIFYSTIKALIYIQIQKIFYNIDETDIKKCIIDSQNGKCIDEFFNERNTNTIKSVVLPFEGDVLKPVSYSDGMKIRRLTREMAVLQSKMELSLEQKRELENKILELSILNKPITEHVTYEYLYPVIEVSRLKASGRYD
jgi:hypothetical protein